MELDPRTQMVPQTMSSAQPGPSPTSPTAGSECPFCHVGLREKFRDIKAEETGERFQIDVCPQCGLGRTRPVPTDLSPYYSAAYYGKRHGPTGRLCNRRRLGFVQRWSGPGLGRSLLDFGCGEGDFLRAAHTQGWESCGIERNQPATPSPDLTVVAGLEELRHRKPFDCATFWHVLEHLDEPVDTLKELRGSLAPDGLVLAAVPNFGSWQARVTGASWLHLDVPRHLFHFTAASLVKLFEESGFHMDALAFGEWEYDVIGWSQSLLNRGLGGRNEFFKAVSGRPDHASPPRKVFQLAAGLGLSLLSAVPAWVEGRIGRAGTLIAVARPAKTWAP